MKSKSLSAAFGSVLLSAAVIAAVFLSGRKGTSSNNEKAQTKPTAAPAGAPTTTAKAIRIDAGSATPLTDAEGNVWLPDQGFTGGSTLDRGNIEIAGTKNPGIYRTEHHSMTAFSKPVPNGAYTVKLHFAETFPRVTKKGQRVFSVKVEDKEIKDLDVLARSGAPRTAWVETVAVEVSDGKLDITFTPGVQRPEINGIEIIPR